MDYWDAFKAAKARTGVTNAGISRDMGHSDNYIASYLQRGSIPSVDNAAAMFAACGHTICAVPSDCIPDNALVIDAPPITADQLQAAKERRRAALQRQLDALG